VNWSIWTPVVAGHGSLVEVQTVWSIDDLVDAHDVIAVKAEVEREHAEQAKREHQKNT
jgi:hypothetical protein